MKKSSQSRKIGAGRNDRTKLERDVDIEIDSFRSRMKNFDRFLVIKLTS